MSAAAITVFCTGPSSWIVNTPVPRSIDAWTLSPSASVTVCVSFRLPAAVVSVSGSSGFAVSSCQMLSNCVNVTTPVALNADREVVRADAASLAVHHAVRSLAQQDLDALAQRSSRRLDVGRIQRKQPRAAVRNQLKLVGRAARTVRAEVRHREVVRIVRRDARQPNRSVPPAVSVPTALSSRTSVSAAAITVFCTGPSSWIVNTPVPRSIDAWTLSPSASVTVCVSFRLPAAVVSVSGSSGFAVSSCQMLSNCVNVTTPVALNADREVVRADTASLAVHHAVRRLAQQDLDALAQRSSIAVSMSAGSSANSPEPLFAISSSL